MHHEKKRRRKTSSFLCLKCEGYSVNYCARAIAKYSKRGSPETPSRVCWTRNYFYLTICIITLISYVFNQLNARLVHLLICELSALSISDSNTIYYTVGVVHYHSVEALFVCCARYVHPFDTFDFTL